MSAVIIANSTISKSVPFSTKAITTKSTTTTTTAKTPIPNPAFEQFDKRKGERAMSNTAINKVARKCTAPWAACKKAAVTY
eukprot:13272280-Ditylum_brightwellii.AAC.1